MVLPIALDDHDDVVAVAPGECDVLGDGAHSIGIGDGRAAVLLHDQGHGSGEVSDAPPGTGRALPKALASALVLHRALDDTYPAEVRDHITLLTGARTSANACFRFAPPFLATIAVGQDVSLDRIGVALAVSELSGLASPLTGRLVDPFHRRTSMAAGLVGVGIGASLAAASGHLVVFTIALVVIAQSKVVFDLGLGAWVSDRVPFERRGRVIGLTETSWAMGLLAGVTTMGLVTAATSWRVGYVVGAVAVIGMAGVVARCCSRRRCRRARPRAAAAHHRSHAPTWVGGGRRHVLSHGGQPVVVRHLRQLVAGPLRTHRHRCEPRGVRPGVR